MTTPPNNDDDVFEPFSEGASASSSRPNEGSNVCRAAALAFLLRGATPAMGGLTTELRTLGFSDFVLLRDDPRGWAGQDPLSRMNGYNLARDTDLNLTRMRGWAEINENANPAGALAFLLAMLGSALERESAAAAAALWRGLRLDTRLSPPSPIARRHLYDRLLFDLDFGGRNDFWLLRPLGFGDPPFPAFDADNAQPWEPDRWRDNYQHLLYRLGQGDRYVTAFYRRVAGIRQDRPSTSLAGCRHPVTRNRRISP